jgi:hypothetical protein
VFLPHPFPESKHYTHQFGGSGLFASDLATGPSSGSYYSDADMPGPLWGVYVRVLPGDQLGVLCNFHHPLQTQKNAQDTTTATSPYIQTRNTHTPPHPTHLSPWSG